MIIKRLIKTIILLFWIVSSATAQDVNYLRFTALEDDVEISLKKTGKINIVLFYSKDGGLSWTEWDLTSTIKLEHQNDYLYFKGTNSSFSTQKNYITFNFNKNITASGSIMSLLDGTGEIKQIPNTYCFYKLFEDCSTLITAPDLTATELKANCYNSLFSGCTALTSINVSFSEWKTGSTTYTANWLNNATSSGIIYGPDELGFNKTYVPSNWLVNPHKIIIKEEERAYIDITNETQYSHQAIVSFKVTRTGYTKEVSVKKKSDQSEIEVTKSSTSYSFTMPNDDVEISATYTPIEYTITKPKYINCEYEKAYIYNTEIPFSVRDSTHKGYRLSEVTINGNPINLNGYDYVFSMADYAANISLKAKYELIAYKINTDGNCSVETDEATIKDKITIKITDKSSIGYAVNKVYINDKTVKVENLEATLDMSKYISDVYITVEYKPISYNINKGENITCSRKTATVEDIIPFTIKNLTSQGYKISKVLVNNQEIEFQDNKASLIMADFISDVTITAEYEPIIFNITAGEYISCNVKTATVESEPIPFTVADRTKEGYELTKVASGTKSIPFENYAGTFNMSDFKKDVSLIATYTPIKYQISKDDNISCRKTTATVEDEVSFTIKNLTSSGLILSKVFVNSQEVNFQDYSASFKMSDYISNVIISAEYQHLDYKITTDENCVANQQFANIDDLIRISAADLTSSGYELEKIFVNGSSITFYKNFCNFMMSDYKSDIEVSTQYKPITYKVKTGKNVYSDNNSATVTDTIIFSVDDLSNEGKIFEGIIVNGQQIEIEGFNDTIFMSDFITDINIEAVYSKYNSITTDNNVIEISHTTAQQGDLITFKINKAHSGFEPLVYVNSRSLSSPDSVNYSFTMFNNDVNIYVEYQEIIIEEPDLQEENPEETEPEIIKKKKPTALNKVKTYPSLAKEGEIITISLENIDSEYLTDSKIIISNISGRILQTIDNPQETIKITLPQGMYKGALISGNKKFTFEFLITK